MNFLAVLVLALHQTSSEAYPRPHSCNRAFPDALVFLHPAEDFWPFPLLNIIISWYSSLPSGIADKLSLLPAYLTVILQTACLGKLLNLLEKAVRSCFHSLQGRNLPESILALIPLLFSSKSFLLIEETFIISKGTVSTFVG